MALTLTREEQSIAAGEQGQGAAMAMRIVAETARLMGHRASSRSRLHILMVRSITAIAVRCSLNDWLMAVPEPKCAPPLMWDPLISPAVPAICCRNMRPTWPDA